MSLGSDGKTSASPDRRIQYDKNTGSPPQTSRASVSWTDGTQHSSSMLGSTESSSTPKDFQPNPAKGLLLLPQIASHACEPVAHVLRLRQHVEDELDRRVELSSGDDLELVRVFDDCGPVAVRCH